ncbi:MAG: exodeoxyribonuclease V subunit gamma [Clostridia bacterium]|nr:exodeoxyribonuclease V subunit gamma [Clostridia bacterium]
MPLTLIFGESGTGKSEYCISSMQGLFQKGTRSMMIVPEQFAHASESRLIEKIGFISDDVTSISFRRLAFKILKKNGTLRNSVTKIGKSMLLSKAILKSGDSLTLYKHAATKPGFIDSMLTFIAECKRSEITPQMLSAAKADNPYFSMKLKELSLIYNEYQALMSADYTDSEDYLTLLSSYLTSNHLFKGTCIFIDEFFRFTPAELDCIHALLVGGAEVYVTLGSLPEAGGIFKPVISTAQSLYAIAHKAGALVNPPIVLTEKHRFKKSAELLHFETEYRNYPPTIYKEETQDISLYIAPDLYTEVQVLAANICKEVAEKGLRYRDIAIIAGDPELYTTLIKTVFPVYQIPVFIDQKTPLLSHPIIIMLLSVFELLTKGIETEVLMDYIKTGYAGISMEEADKLENFALSGRLKQKDWLDHDRFLKQADSVFYQTEDFEQTNALEAEALLSIRDRVLSPLLTLRNDLAENRQASHRAEALFHFFENIGLYNKVKEESEFMKTTGQHQLAQEHGEIYNLLISLLDELVTCLGEEKIGMKRLKNIITAGLSQCEMSTIPPAADQVVLGDTGRSLVKNIKALYVIGANAGTFPSAPPQEGLIKDSERTALENQGLNLGPDGKKIAFQNQYLVYSALTVSSASMHISYAVADLEGKGLLPSPLIERLYKLFPNLSVTDNLLTPPEPDRLIAGKQSAWQYLLEHFTDTDATASALRKRFKQDPDYEKQYAAMLTYSQYTHRVPDLSPALAQSLYGHNLRGSITQLESYSLCPFSYFLRYGLRAKERKILKIDAPDIGHLLHKLVEIASQKITRNNGSFATLDEEAVTHLANDTVDELFATLFIQHLYTESRLHALIRRLKVQLAKMLQMIVTHVKKGEFEPCAFEVAFDEKGELPPVTVTLPTGETITLIGRIDRIDVLQKDAEIYIKIIDYKTGNKSFRLSDVYNGLSLQLAVYLTAASEGDFLGENIKPAGMFYFRLADQTVNATEKNTEAALLKQFKMSGLLLKDADIVRAMDQGISGHSAILPAYIKKDGTLSESSGSYATLEQFKKLSAYIRKTAGELGREILHGGAAISPCKNNQSLPCEYCRYHSVCAFRADTDPYRVAPPLKDDAIWELLSE